MAFIRASEPQKSEQNFVAIIYGAPGTGKTTIALSAPDPILIDFDNGMHRVAAWHRKDYIHVDRYEDVLNDIQIPEIKAAKTLIIDTGGSFVTYLKDWAFRTQPTARTKGGEFNSLKGFGFVKNEFARLTSQIKDIMHKNLIYVFHSTEQADKDGNPQQRLMCEGQARNTVWNACDFGGYLQVVNGKRMLCLSPQDEYFAKGCHGITGMIEVPELKMGEPNDFMTRLFDRARQNIDSENDYWKEEKGRYDEVMEQVKAIVAGVTGPQSATEAAAALGEIQHVLTSKDEARTMLREKTEQIGLKWSTEAKAYVEAE